MRLINTYFISSLLAIAIIGCNRPGSSVNDRPVNTVTADLIDSIEIKGNTSEIRTIKVLGPIALVITDDSEGFIKELTYPQYECIDSAGFKGQGPGEWISVMVGQSPETDEIPVYDIMNRILRIASVKDSTIIITDVDNLPTDEDGLSLPFGDIIKTNSNIWLVKENDMHNGTTLSTMDLKTQEKHASFRPTVNIDLPIKGYPNDDYHIATDNRVIAIGYSSFNRVDILDATTLEVLQSYGKDSPFEKNKTFTRQALHHNGKFYLLQDTENKNDPSPIRVFSDKGEEDTILLSDNVKLIAFDNDGLLLGIKETPEANVCIRYKLP